MAIHGRWRESGYADARTHPGRRVGERLGGRHAGLNALDAQRLAGALGWFSVGLGVAGVAAPRVVARMIGVKDGRTATTALRLVGARELASGVGILTGRRHAGWLWARVAGDVMDLVLLGAAMTSRRARRDRVKAATAAVLGVTALDAMAARQLQDGAAGRRLGTRAVRKSITLNRPADPLYRFWRDFANLPRFMHNLESVQVLGERRSRWKAHGPGGIPVEWESEVTDERPGELIAWRTVPGSQVEHSGVVRFTPAPGGRGTEVTVEMDYTPPGGALTATMAWLVGQAPGQQIAEDLRRFKQLMEAGELVVSEALVSGVAQPPASAAAVRAVVKGGAR
jgi:uncharacterized membrane protein